MVSEKLARPAYRYPTLLAITCLLVASGYLWRDEKYAVAAFLIVLGIVLVIAVSSVSDRISRDIAFFFSALRNNDTTMQFPKIPGNKSLSSLYESMNQLNNHFQAIKLKNEYNENYYKTLIHLSSSGVIVLNDENTVELINQTACRYAGIPDDSTNLKLLGIKNPRFMEAMLRLKPGENAVFKHVIGSDYHLLAFRATLLRISDRQLKLISIHDIRNEIESREIESYRKLIRVLTHEIMNLVSPLTSASSSLEALYNIKEDDIRVEDITEDMLKTTRSGLRVINEHSKGLTRFIETYRKISRIPNPVVGLVDVKEWIEQLKIVFSNRMADNKISFRISKDNRITTLLADKNLLNQVMLNLINNAVDAVLENNFERQINIEFSERPNTRIRITVSNNGPGIPPEILDKIFVPFFTTKKHGSGIGLSICQEIVKLHKGSIAVVSMADGSTGFILEL